MPNAIKYSTTNISDTIRKSNMAIGVNSIGYGPTSSTGYYNGHQIPDNGYVIYINKSSNGPSIYAPANDSELINIVQRLGGSNINTAVDALSWVNSQSEMAIVNRQYTNMVTNGLVLCLDASFISSYPKGNTTWYDISGNNGNVTLSNGPTFNSEGIGNIVFDGSDDFANFYAPNLGSTTTVEMVCKIGSAYGGKMFFGWLYYDVWCGGDNLGYNTAGGDIYGISSSSVSSLGLVNNWKHYVFEMRSDVPYSNNKIYVNGVSQTLSQQWGSENPGARNFNSGSGRISSWLADLGYPMPMNCVSFKVYNRALSTSEILLNYYKNNLITTNITHRWDFSNVVSYPGTGTSVKNLSGSVNGILWNSPTFKSQFGGYVTFDGTNDYMELIGGNYAITLGDGNSPWTVSAWVRTTTSVDGLGAGSVLSNSSGGPVYSMMGVNDGKIVYWAYPSNINSWKSFKGNKTVTDGNWHLLTWVQNTGYSMDMYVDGVLDVTVSPTNTGNNNPVDIIGGSWAATFNGDIGEVQINTKAFTSTEVTQQYTSTNLRYQVTTGPVTNGLILHWDPANINSYPGSGTVIYDLSGNGYHGTLYNGVGFSRVNGGVLTFDGTNDYVYGGPNMSSSNYTLMGAARYVTISGRIIAGGNNWLLGHWAGYTNDHYAEGWVYYNPTIQDTNWAIYASSGNISQDSYQFYMNNVLLASNDGGNQGPN